MNPLVSLVTPVYNGMPYFKEYLNSVLSQTWRPLEFICINDGSDDDSFEYLESLREEFEKSDIVLINKKIEHCGQAAAFNEALKYVRGEFLTWCDADDIMADGSIEKKAYYLINKPNIGMVRNDGKIVEEGKKEIRSSLPLDRKVQNIFDALFHDVTYCYAGCYMIRTKLLFECYPDRNIPVSLEGQNLQLLLPPASRSECGYIDEQLHLYRKREDGHSGKKRSYTQNLQRLKNFTELKIEILKYCRCDSEFYKNEALKIEAQKKKQLLQSAVLKAREEFKK